MSTLIRAIADISWLLGSGIIKVQRSPMGAMLERAELFAFGEDGKRHVRTEYEFWDMPVDGSPGVTKRRRIALPERTWHGMIVKPERHESSGYELETETMCRLGRAWRLLDAVGAKSQQARVVLETFYGDQGAHWGGTRLGRPGALFPFTEVGRGIVTVARRDYELSAGVRDDQLIAGDVESQKLNPNDVRGKRHARMRAQAKLLETEAHDILKEVAA